MNAPVLHHPDGTESGQPTPSPLEKFGIKRGEWQPRKASLTPQQVEQVEAGTIYVRQRFVRPNP